LQVHLHVGEDELLTEGSGGENFIFGSTRENERKQGKEDRTRKEKGKYKNGKSE
jgi:hypothetical protein